MKFKYLILVFLVVALLAELVLLFTGGRILIVERVIKKGQEDIDEDGRPYIDESGVVRLAKNDLLFCSYFTGRSVINRTYYYSSNGIMGHDECKNITLNEE